MTTQAHIAQERKRLLGLINSYKSGIENHRRVMEASKSLIEQSSRELRSCEETIANLDAIQDALASGEISDRAARDQLLLD